MLPPLLVCKDVSVTGKHIKHLRVNYLTLSQGWDKIWRVRSPEHPPRVLHEAPSQEEAYRWAHGYREFEGFW